MVPFPRRLPHTISLLEGDGFELPVPRVLSLRSSSVFSIPRALALMTLDFSAMTGPKWAHRFIISVGRVAEDCVLLFYGARFGALMELPANPEYSVPMMAHLPARYAPVFAKGCVDAMLQGGPVRIQGAVDREDGQQELYRAAFVRLSIDAKRLQRLALGAFNCRVTERRA
jgi:hypothetical protein